MGWRFRKSINLGLGFRINLSKTGIGYSWGFPGYRTTKLANGGTKQTYSIPGTGISYVEQQGKRKNPEVQYYDETSKLITGETEVFNNIPISDITKNDPIIKHINNNIYFNRLANLLILLFPLIFIDKIYIIVPIIGLLIKLLIAVFFNIKLYYEFDDDRFKLYCALKEILIVLSNNRRLWQINGQTRVYNKKYNAGAGNNVSRSVAFVIDKLPWFIKTNIDVYGLNLNGQKIFFTPDRVLVFNSLGGVFGCTYRDMQLLFDWNRFVESEGVPADAQVVDRAWRYSNADGSRDLRFNNNRSYPVCKYGELIIKSPNGINTIIQFSNFDTNIELQHAMILFGNQFNKLLAIEKKAGEQ